MQLNLITDRTQADVTLVNQLRAKGWANMTEAERTAYLAGLKGAYNATDLNRVEQAVHDINDYINGIQAELDSLLDTEGVAPDQHWAVPFSPLTLTTKTDWARSDIPTPSDLGRYLSNVDALTDQLPIDKSLPEDMERLGYESANEIERALLAEYDAAAAYSADREAAIKNTAMAYAYSGELYGGEWN